KVYNIRTRKVEENLHIRFLKNKTIIVGTEESIGVGHASNVTGSSNDYILMPLWKDGLLFDSSSNNSRNNEPQPSSDDGNKDDESEEPKKVIQSLKDPSWIEAIQKEILQFKLQQ
nr:hypothetical protein [Tanacetum cinerariifolium]